MYKRQEGNRSDSLLLDGKLLPLVSYRHKTGVASLPSEITSSHLQEYPLFLAQNQVIPPWSQAVVDLEAPGLPQGFTGITHGNPEFMRATDLHPVHAALTYSDRLGRLLCTLMNSCPHPVSISRGQVYGLLREAKSNQEDFYNPWAIQFIEESLSPIEGLPEASPQEKEQENALERKRRRQWLIEQFRTQ